MSDLKDTVVPGAVPEEKPAEAKTDLTDKDLDSVAGGMGHASLPQAQLNIGHSLTHEGRSVVSSVGLPNQGQKLDKL
jgi:hypothetical protein